MEAGDPFMGLIQFIERRPFTPSPTANLVDNKRQITEYPSYRVIGESKSLQYICSDFFVIIVVLYNLRDNINVVSLFISMDIKKLSKSDL